MNKGRRQELVKLKYKRRLKLHKLFSIENLNCTQGKTSRGISINLSAYKSTSGCCSCYMCSGYYKYNRAKTKKELRSDLRSLQAY